MPASGLGRIPGLTVRQQSSIPFRLPGRWLPGPSRDGGARRVPQDRLVTGLVPHVSAATLVPVGGGVGAPAGVDPDTLARAEGEGGEPVDVVAGVSQRP